MSDYRGLLREIAVPRLTGTLEHSRVRAVLARELSERGYRVLEHEFPVNTSAGPGQLVPAGAALAIAAFGSIVVQLLGLPRVATLAWLAVNLMALAATLAWRARRGPWAGGVNLIGVRPETRVSLWLTAHYDSKGQPLSMAWRIAAVTLAIVGTLSLLGGWWQAPALLGGVLLAVNRVTNNSPGAVDNASALVTVFDVLDRLPRDAAVGVGVVFPDGEEYGLVGARALARERPNLFQGTVVINLDGIDDRGRTICFVHRPGPAIDAVAKACGAQRRRMLPVIVDGLALAPVARECATLMRGNWRTAAIVHTPRDTADRLTLVGSGAVAEALARACVDAARERL